MTVLQAALNRSVFEAAKAYLAANVSVIPLNGKQPALKQWKQYQTSRPTLRQLHEWNKAGLFASGVGVICGRVSGNLVVLDLDSADMVGEFSARFPELTHTFGVLSGSRRGIHFYYYVARLPMTTIAPLIELRSTGAYVAAPPSVHPVSGLLYISRSPYEPMRLDNLDKLVEWVKSKRPAPPPRLTKPVSPAPKPQKRKGGFVPREQYFEQKYVDAAMVDQLAYIITAPFGTRNTQLYRSAVALGQLVGSGALSRTRAEKELLDTALFCGLEAKEALPTIKSGLETGMLTPRNIPPAPPLPTDQN